MALVLEAVYLGMTSVILLEIPSAEQGTYEVNESKLSWFGAMEGWMCAKANIPVFHVSRVSLRAFASKCFI